MKSDEIEELKKKFKEIEERQLLPSTNIKEYENMISDFQKKISVFEELPNKLKEEIDNLKNLLRNEISRIEEKSEINIKNLPNMEDEIKKVIL